MKRVVMVLVPDGQKAESQLNIFKSGAEQPLVLEGGDNYRRWGRLLFFTSELLRHRPPEAKA